jgi:Holliday junction resolvase RusA-like endonuclease
LKTLRYRLKLPFPPSVNGLYGGGSGQQRFKTKRYKDWCKSIKHIPSLNINYPITILYTFTWPDKRKRDGQNYIKAVTDLMVNSKLISDDSWDIIQSETWKYDKIDRENSGVLVEIFDA